MHTEHDYLQQVTDYQHRKDRVWDWLLVSAILVSLVMVLIAVATVRAAPHTVTLTAEQETALLAATEQANDRRGCTMLSCGDKKDAAGQPLLPLTVDQGLTQIISADLTNVLRNLDATIAPVMDNLKALDAATLRTVLATIPSQATKARLQQKLTP